jgi:hypothetical protein
VVVGRLLLFSYSLCRDGVHLTVVRRAIAISASLEQVADERECDLLTGDCYFDIARKRTEGRSCKHVMMDTSILHKPSPRISSKTSKE